MKQPMLTKTLGNIRQGSTRLVSEIKATPRYFLPLFLALKTFYSLQTGGGVLESHTLGGTDLKERQDTSTEMCKIVPAKL